MCCIRLSSFQRQVDANSALARNVREFGTCHSVDDLLFDKSFQFIPLVEDEAIRNCVCRGGINLYRTGADVQLLSPYNRSGILSSDVLNVIFRESLNPATEKNTIEGVFFHLRDRVMVQQNDWQQKICNGDIGMYIHSKQPNGDLGYGVICGKGRQQPELVKRQVLCPG